MVVLPDGSLLIVFLHDASPGQQGTLVLARSTDGGATFAPNATLFAIQQAPFMLPGEHWRQFTYHSLAYDPARSGLILVWPDYRDAAANGEDILFSRSTDTGASWTAPARLNDDPPGVVKDQWFPVVAAAPDGRLTALWLDRRDDPANRLYYAYRPHLHRRRADLGPRRPCQQRALRPQPEHPDRLRRHRRLHRHHRRAGRRLGRLGGRPQRQPGHLRRPRAVHAPAGAHRYTFAHADAWPGPQRHAEPDPVTTATPACANPLFSDVPPSQPFYAYIQWLACRGYISGYPAAGRASRATRKAAPTSAPA